MVNGHNGLIMFHQGELVQSRKSYTLGRNSNHSVSILKYAFDILMQIEIRIMHQSCQILFNIKLKRIVFYFQ